MLSTYIVMAKNQIQLVLNQIPKTSASQMKHIDVCALALALVDVRVLFREKFPLIYV